MPVANMMLLSLLVYFSWLNEYINVVNGYHLHSTFNSRSLTSSYTFSPSFTSSIASNKFIRHEIYSQSSRTNPSQRVHNHRYMSMTTIEPPPSISINPSSPSSSSTFEQILLPKHERLVEGKLDNGFSYIIYPNTVPPGRFEAHLEVLSGSAHELEDQQGMAHLLEHVAYMGSPKRQLISGTGSRTNAYTDFHHTVFYAACPTMTPDQFWKKPMLPMALDALLGRN